MMEKIKIIHRMDDDQVTELRELATLLSYEIEQVMPADWHPFRITYKALEVLVVLVMAEMKEWGTDCISLSEVLENYQEMVLESVGDRMTPKIQDLLSAVYEALEHMINISYSPISLEEVEAMVDDRIPMVDDKTYTTTGYDISINPISYILKIIPTILEEEYVKH